MIGRNFAEASEKLVGMLKRAGIEGSKNQLTYLKAALATRFQGNEVATLVGLADPERVMGWLIEDGILDKIRQRETGGADASADRARKNRQQLPDSVDARDLAHELERQLRRGGKSQMQIAREFTRGDERKACSLLRIIRKYPLLHEAVTAAAKRAGK